MGFSSFISQHLPEVLAVVAIITAFLIPVAEKAKHPTKALCCMLGVSFSICAVLFAVKERFDRQYCLVPDLIGLTYDEAILEMKEAGLDPRFVLTSTNDLTSTSCRISWQSLEPKTVENRDKQCVLILEDNYQSDTTPYFEVINHLRTFFVYMSKKITWNRDIESEIVLSPTIQGPNITQFGTITTNFSDFNFDRTPTLSSFAGMLSEAISSHLRSGNHAANIAECELYAKLFLNNCETRYNIYSPTINPDWHILLPQIIVYGDHNLVVNIVTENGKCYEFQIPVLIENDQPDPIDEDYENEKYYEE